jgi:raffinose/stachyose/melibiose transport system permease protein
VLTNGGPGDRTEVINTAVFKEFQAGRFGFATALGVVVFLVALFFAYFVIKVMTREEVEL